MSLFKLIDCPNGWKLFQNHCYLMPSKPIILQQSTWHDARSFCVASGADLVSLNSQTEESFVNKQIEIWGNYLYYWIGLTDEDVEGKWKWTDGSPVNYTNFTRTQGFNDSQVNGTNFTGSQINTERLDFVRVENGIWKYSDDMYPDINSGRWMALICESSGMCLREYFYGGQKCENFLHSGLAKAGKKFQISFCSYLIDQASRSEF